MPVDKGIQILIVDDQDTILEILRAYLRSLGFRDVKEARSAAEALLTLRESPDPFGLILSDWNMQPVTGMQLLQAVRRDPRFKDVPFIMITGENTKDRVVAAMQAGVTSYLVKPLSRDALKQRLVSVFGEF